MALMLFQFARFEACIGEEGVATRLQEQDRSKWNAELIRAGLMALDRSRTGSEPTAYHLEARIAAEHVTSSSFAAADYKRTCARTRCESASRKGGVTC